MRLCFKVSRWVVKRRLVKALKCEWQSQTTALRSNAHMAAGGEIQLLDESFPGSKVLLDVAKIEHRL